MKYVSLGSSELKVSRLCLGMMSDGNPPGAAESGMTFLDTADMYAEGASERLTGSLLRGSSRAEEEYVLATKVFFPMGESRTCGSRLRHIEDALSAIDLELSQPDVARLEASYRPHRVLGHD